MNETASTRKCFCRYLQTLAGEHGYTAAVLADKTHRSCEEVEAVFNGSEDQSLDAVIDIVAVLDLSLTVRKEVSFYHQKLVMAQQRLRVG